MGVTASGLEAVSYTHLDVYKRQAAALANLVRYAEAVKKDELYQRDTYVRQTTKTSRPLGLFDCVKAPCTDICPISQDVPAYMQAVMDGDVDEAAAIVRRDNMMGHTLGCLLYTSRCV